VPLALLAALASALCYGFATVLQALGARATPYRRDIDVRLLVRVLRQGPFVAGMALDLAGFLCQFWALRYLPLFLVQAAQAGNLAVTAVVAVPVLQVRLAARQASAVVAACAGLALLALSAGEQHPAPAGPRLRFGLLACVGLLAIAGFAAGRAAAPVRSVALGLVAGLGFGTVAVAVRTLTSLAPAHLLRDPSAYALAAGGVLAFLFYATGLQRGSVTAVAAAVVVAETAVPAAIGVLALGDGTRPGLVPLAVAGFGLSVAGAMALARFAEPVPAHYPSQGARRVHRRRVLP
jgi:drug/metabolite transporter (DMT)-like permease